MTDKPHITICSKNPNQVEQNSHEAIHGYTRSLTDWHLVNVKRSIEKSDNHVVDGKVIWPDNLPAEDVVHSTPSEDTMQTAADVAHATPSEDLVQK